MTPTDRRGSREQRSAPDRGRECRAESERVVLRLRRHEAADTRAGNLAQRCGRPRHHHHVPDSKFHRLVDASLPLLKDLVSSGLGVTYDFSRVIPPEEDLPPEVRARPIEDQEAMRRMWFCSANIDNRWGPTTAVPARDHVHHLTAALAVVIQPAVAQEIGQWPACPIHAEHAMECHIASEEVVWRCPIDTSVTFAVGALPRTT